LYQGDIFQNCNQPTVAMKKYRVRDNQTNLDNYITEVLDNVEVDAHEFD